jgi:uncharacterized repeat protein (TIGR03803 family)
MTTRINRLCIFTMISLLTLFGFADQAGAQGYVFNRLNGPPKSRAKAAKTHKAKSGGADSSNYQVLYNFCSAPNCTDGRDPIAGLIQDAAGNLYGTTAGGAASNGGAVFTVDPTGQETVLYSFCALYPGPCDGAGPVGVLVEDAAGNLYGTTLEGSGRFGGTVFEVDAAGHETVLHDFGFPSCVGVEVCTDGGYPAAGLIRDAEGNFYGTTSFGGANVSATVFGGTVFAVDTTGHETVLYSFCSASNCTDGEYPVAALIADAAGNLYGTTAAGGTGGDCAENIAPLPGGGTVFKLDPTGHETVLYSFCSAPGYIDGAVPEGALIRDVAGNFYGTTSSGGANGGGTVFEVDSTGREAVLYSFCSASNCTDGEFPYADLIADAAGDLYGTTYYGGANAHYDSGLQRYIGGTIFKLVPPAQPGSAWTETVLYSFCSASNCTDGYNPTAGLIADAAGNLYGTTGFGGAGGCCGTVFSLATGSGLGYGIASSTQSLSLQAGQSGTATITVTPTSGFFNGQITFSCRQQTLVSCSFSPTTITANGAPVSTVLTVTASSAAASLRAPALHGRAPLTLAFGATFASFALGTVLIGFPRRNRMAGALFALLVAVAISPITGCGSSGGPRPQTATLTVSATAGSNSSQSLSLTVTVTP